MRQQAIVRLIAVLEDKRGVIKIVSTVKLARIQHLPDLRAPSLVARRDRCPSPPRQALTGEHEVLLGDALIVGANGVSGCAFG